MKLLYCVDYESDESSFYSFYVFLNRININICATCFAVTQFTSFLYVLTRDREHIIKMFNIRFEK